MVALIKDHHIFMFFTLFYSLAIYQTIWANSTLIWGMYFEWRHHFIFWHAVPSMQSSHYCVQERKKQSWTGRLFFTPTESYVAQIIRIFVQFSETLFFFSFFFGVICKFASQTRITAVLYLCVCICLYVCMSKRDAHRHKNLLHLRTVVEKRIEGKITGSIPQNQRNFSLVAYYSMVWFVLPIFKPYQNRPRVFAQRRRELLVQLYVQPER